MMTPAQSRSRVGEVRPSQLLHTFGIGSIVDLPHLAVMVMGLDEWQPGYAQEIGEERLLAAVREQLGPQVERLCSPPLPPDPEPSSGWGLDDGNRIGVPVAPFPTWMRCPRCALLAPLGELFQLKTDAYRPDRARYVHVHCPHSNHPPPVLPARFLVACEHGHLDDFPWLEFVHGEDDPCPGPLRMKVLGVSGEAADVQVSCVKCEKRRRMSDAIGKDAPANLPKCRGFHPHLRSWPAEQCGQPLRTITLGASNSWFALTLSVLSIPSATDALAKLVEDHWVVLSKASSQDVLAGFFELWRAEAKRPELTAAPVDAVWEAINTKRTATDGEAAPANLRDPEWAVLSKPDPSRYSSDFRLAVVRPPSGFEDRFRQVVLGERLREVQAFVGFTRIDALGDLSGEVQVDRSRIAPMARKAPNWAPAAEVRGEGIFLQLDEAKIRAWCGQPAVLERERILLDGHRRWRTRRGIKPAEADFPGIRYVLLHSLAHAIMRQLATECGYTAASIRERIYCAGPDEPNGPQAGCLIYTCAPDSEGTLGGLVELGQPRRLGRHLSQALADLQFCASDPLCAEHVPDQDGTTVHGAACHACLLAPETSCERGNRYLDRAVLVPVFGSTVPPFFD